MAFCDHMDNLEAPAWKDLRTQVRALSPTPTYAENLTQVPCWWCSPSSTQSLPCLGAPEGCKVLSRGKEHR